MQSLPPTFLKRIGALKESAAMGERHNEKSIGLPFEEVAGEKERIKQMLRITSGNKRRAAIMLGMARSTFYEKLKKYNL